LLPPARHLRGRAPRPLRTAQGPADRGAAGRGGPFLMQPVLAWVRANVYTVVFGVIMLAAPIALWIISGNMNAAVRAEDETRPGRMNQPNKFESTTIDLVNPVPGNEPVSGRIAVNRTFLNRYQEVVGKLRDDAQRIREEVLKINRKDRTVLNDKLFPS